MSVTVKTECNVLGLTAKAQITKDGALVIITTIATDMTPEELARVLTLVKQKAPMKMTVYSEQAQFDLQLVDQRIMDQIRDLIDNPQKGEDSPPEA